MIEVNDIHFTYPTGVTVLNGVSIKVGYGEFLAVMGENGAGKTTLVKHFNGLLKPSQGEILVDGVATTKASVAQLSRKIGLVFQNPDHQFFCETVEEEIAFGLRNFGFSEEAIKEKIDFALNLLDLGDYRKTSPFMLSGGEKKRLALATVLTWDPTVLILDEPTVGQDYSQKEKLRQFILKLNSEGKTVIIVTHDIEFVAECNPRVVILSHGRIIADGPAKKVLTNFDQVKEASLVPPQMTQVFLKLTDMGFTADTIDVNEAKDKIMDYLQRSPK